MNRNAKNAIFGALNMSQCLGNLFYFGRKMFEDLTNIMSVPLINIMINMLNFTIINCVLHILHTCQRNANDENRKFKK